MWTKNPEEFKIDCLSGIANLFPNYWDPFYAGFGNKSNDEKAYRTVRFCVHNSSLICYTHILRLRFLTSEYSQLTKKGLLRVLICLYLTFQRVTNAWSKLLIFSFRRFGKLIVSKAFGLFSTYGLMPILFQLDF